MRAVAIPMILLMLSASFAGCTSGDPDGDGTSGIDMEILNQMIDDNLQDFINNTSVTVVNNHYSNETHHTYNTYNGSSDHVSIAEDAHVLNYTVSYSFDSYNYSNDIFMIDGILQHPAIGDAPILSYNYGGQTIDFDFTCEEFQNAYHRYYYGMHQQEWLNWAYDYIGLSYSQSNSFSAEIVNDILSYSEEFEEYCRGGTSTHGADTTATQHRIDLFSIDIQRGEALSFDFIANQGFNFQFNCSDGFIKNGTSSQIGTYYYSPHPEIPFLGGWADCTFDAFILVGTTFGWEYSHIDDYSNYTFYPFPTWHYYQDDRPRWWWNGYTTDSTYDGFGQVYFTKHHMIVEE